MRLRSLPTLPPRRKGCGAASAAASTNSARGRCRCCPRAESGCGAARPSTPAPDLTAEIERTRAARQQAAAAAEAAQAAELAAHRHRRKPRPRVQPRKHTRNKTATSCGRPARKIRRSARGNTSFWRRCRGRCSCRLLRLSCCLPSCAVRNLRCKLNAKGIAEQQAARERAEQLRPLFAELVGMSARKAAEELNRRSVATAAGGKWHAATVLRVRKRLDSRTLRAAP